MVCANAWRYDRPPDKSTSLQAIERSGWRGELELRYERRGAATVLASRRHVGPIVVQKPFYPEDRAVCHGIVLHPPGGIVGGDRIAIEASVGPNASALLTTPGAGKWYRSAGPHAEQQLRFSIAANATLEWMPQGTIVFDGARGCSRVRIDLAADGVFIGWEVICLGRTAAGERFACGEMSTDVQISHAGAPLWIERGRITGGSRLLDSPVGLAGEPVHGTLVAVSSRADAALVSECRKEAPQSGRAGITRLPGLLVARYLGDRSDAAHEYFARLWHRLRPALLGREAVAPRIWRT